MRRLGDAIKDCKGVEQAEQICKDLDQFFADNPLPTEEEAIEVNDSSNDNATDEVNDSSNDNASSIEQLQHEDGDEREPDGQEADCEEDESGSGADKENSVTEQILETYSDVE